GGGTRGTYKFGVGVGSALPGPVARRAHRSTLKASVEDLKREAERRAASATKAPPSTPPEPVVATAQAESKTPDGAEDSAAEREAKLAERVGISQPARHTEPSRPEPAGDWGSDGSHTVAELPGVLIGEAASIGRRVARRGVRTAQEVGGGATEVGLDAARRAVRAGREVAGAMIKPWMR